MHEVEKASIDVTVHKGDVIVGYVAAFKVLSSDGTPYWATRIVEINDMEALGLATDMVNSFGSDMLRCKRVLPDEE